MKVLMYCQHVLGIGHLVRSTEIARALSRNADVTFVSGGESVDGFAFPPGVKLVQLPAIQTDEDFGALENCGSSQTLEQLQGLRRKRLLGLFDEIRPDALVIELFPFGRKRFAFELVPLLERARTRNSETLVASSVRDILVEKSDQAKHEERVCRIVNAYFDLILVHGDPAFQKLDETFHRVGDLHCEVRYTGFVQQEEPALATEEDPPLTGPTIVASIGSGRYRQGQLMLENVIRAAALLQEQIPHRFRVFAGPFVPPEVYEVLKRLAGETRNVELDKYSPNFIECLKRADLSISMGGYNTIMNLLATGVRSLVYPYTANNDQEQHIRARKLESLGAVELLHPEMLPPKVLAPRHEAFVGRPARPAALLIALALMPGALYAQGSEGGIQGRVTDSSEAVIPGAAVQVKGPSGFSRTVTTDAEGKFAINGLGRGSYSILVDWPGFAPFRSEPLDVSGGRPKIFNVNLKVSDSRQEVTVQADAFEPVNVSAQSNASAIILREKDLESLPDDPDDLLADLKALAGPALTQNGSQIFVDGFSGGRMPSKESIREIRINQNPFAAEYDLPGFGRIEVFTKPGANKFHGQMSVKFSDAFLNSRNPFSAAKPPYQSRDFDGSVEGPLWKRASFFAEVERRTIDQSAIVNAVGLDDFRNVIRLNQAIPNPQTHTMITPRVDYQINDTNTLTARYVWTDISQLNAGTGGFSLFSRSHNSDDTSHTLQLTENAVLSNSTINQTRFQFMRSNFFQHGDNTLPAVNVLDSFLGGGAQVGLSSDIQNHYELQNYTSLTRGAHSIRFGGRLRVVSLADSSTQNYGGTFTFGGGTAPLLDGSGQPILDSSGQPLLGYISSLERYRRTLLFQEDGLSAAQIRALGGGPSQFSLVGGLRWRTCGRPM